MTTFKIWHMGVIRCAHRTAYYYFKTTADGCVSMIQLNTENIKTEKNTSIGIK